MLKALSLAGATAVIAMSSFANASVDTFHCVFTEPFVNFRYSEADQKLAISTPETLTELPNGTTQDVPLMELDVRMVKKEDGKLLLVDSNDVLRYTLTLTNKGSDGMSDAVYPYDIQSETGLHTQYGQIGACYTDALPRTEP